MKRRESHRRLDCLQRNGESVQNEEVFKQTCEEFVNKYHFPSLNPLRLLLTSQLQLLPYGIWGHKQPSCVLYIGSRLMCNAMFLCEHSQALVISFTYKQGERFWLGSPRTGSSCTAGFSLIKACSCLSSQGRGSWTEILASSLSGEADRGKIRNP